VFKITLYIKDLYLHSGSSWSWFSTTCAISPFHH